jgi:hypothetical protein
MSSTASASSVPARGLTIKASSHCLDRYSDRRNDLRGRLEDLQQARRAALPAVQQLFRRGEIRTEPPEWVQASRRNPFYLVVGNNVVCPLEVLEDGTLLAVTLLERGAVDRDRLPRRPAAAAA